MEYQQIPYTELYPSAICFGTALIGSQIEQLASFRLLDQFVDCGGTFIDTALAYANWLPGEESISEKTIGQWMKRTRQRHKLILATKGGHPDFETMHISRLGKQDLSFDLDQSLLHLQTDYIDLYWLHRDATDQPVGEILESLNELVQTGKIRYFGCSNWSIDRIEQAQTYAESHGLQGFVANQNKWSLAKMPQSSDPGIVAMDDGALAYHKRSGLTAIPFSSQAKGLFSGRYSKDMLLSPSQATERIAGFCHPENAEKLGRVMQLAGELKVSGTVIALSYLRSQAFPVYPIIGSRTTEQLEDSCSAGDMVLDPEHVRYLETGNLKK